MLKVTYAIHLGYHCPLPLWAPSPRSVDPSRRPPLFFNFNSSCDIASTVNRSVLRLSLRLVRRQTCLSTRSFSVEGLVAKGSLFFHHLEHRITKKKHSNNTPRQPATRRSCSVTLLSSSAHPRTQEKLFLNSKELTHSVFMSMIAAATSFLVVFLL